MQAPMWIRLFQRLPEEIHNNVVLMTATGIEIRMMKIFRLEEEFAVIRGRLTGANDDGRIMMVPYDGLSAIAIDRNFKDQQVNELFDGVAPVKGFSQKSFSESDDEELEPTEAECEPAESENTPVDEKAKPSKSILLARLRDRLAKHESSQS